MRYKIEIEFAESTTDAVAGRLREIADLIEENSLDEGDGWEILPEPDLIAKPAPRKYDVEIRVEQIVEDSELDSDDREGGPECDYEYTVEAYTEEGAREAALDRFHSGVPIRTLDDYEITPTVRECAEEAAS